MTTSTVGPTVAADRGRPASQLARTTRFSVSSVAVTLRKGMFLFFTILLPVGMFLLFNGLYGKEVADDGSSAGLFVMVHMAAYGALGAAINAGAIIQLERTNGWLRQLMVAGLTPRSFVVGKLAAAMAVVLPALVAVFVVGALVGVPISPVGAVRSILVIWVTMIPIVLLGVVVGLSLKPSAVQPASTISMMALAIVGGLWVPLDQFPSWMQTVGHVTPTYWIGQLGAWAAAGGDLPMTGVAVLAAWTAGLGVLCALLLRRAVRASSRR